MGIQERRRIRRVLTAGLVLSAIGMIWSQIPILRSAEQSTLDFRYRVWNRLTPASDRVKVIDIDKRSVTFLSQTYGRWPRKVFKELIEFLSSLNEAGLTIRNCPRFRCKCLT